MKKRWIASMLYGLAMLIGFQVLAQEVITYHTQQSVNVEIIKNGKRKIKYTLADEAYPKKIFKVSKRKLYSIQFANGEVWYSLNNRKAVEKNQDSRETDWKIRRKRDSARHALNIDVLIPLLKHLVFYTDEYDNPPFYHGFIQHEWMPNPHFSWGARIFFQESIQQDNSTDKLYGNYLVGNGKTADQIIKYYYYKYLYQGLGLGLQARVHPFGGIGKLSVGVGLDLMGMKETYTSSYAEKAYKNRKRIYYRNDPQSKYTSIYLNFRPYIVSGWKFLIGDNFFIEPNLSVHYAFKLEGIRPDLSVSAGFTF